MILYIYIYIYVFDTYIYIYICIYIYTVSTILGIHPEQNSKHPHCQVVEKAILWFFLQISKKNKILIEKVVALPQASRNKHRFS